MRKTESETGLGNSIRPQLGAAANANTSDALRHDPPSPPARLAFYGRTNQRGQGTRTELAIQLGLCRTVLGRQAVITRTYYDIPEPVTALPDFTGIDAGGMPGAGGWDELAAAMGSPGARDFEAVICTTADRISRRIPVLLAREEFARRCGTPILCADELAIPGQHRSVLRQLRRWPFTPPVPGVQAPEGTIRRLLSQDAPSPAAGNSRPAAAPCPCACNRGGFCGGCGHAGCGARQQGEGRP
jgi:hypothetical protein